MAFSLLLRDSRSQTHVWAALVVMANPLSQYQSQMPLAEWNQEVQTLAPERSHQPFAVRIRLGSPNWRPQHSEAECFQLPIQISREDRIAVMNHKLVQMFTGIASRNCCNVHNALGCAVTLQCKIFRVPTSITTRM